MQELGSMLTRISVAALAIAVPVVWIGLRGRRVDDHPVCRKCGFDLFGLPPESTRCPECGRDLTRRRARRLGNRRHRRWLVTAGVILFLAGGGWLGFHGYRATRTVNVSTYKPVSWLIRDARSVATRKPAMDEILARLGRGELTGGEIHEIAEAALAHQANRSQNWVGSWGIFLERARNRGVLSDAQWERYLRGAIEHYILEARPIVRRGSMLPVRIRVVPARANLPNVISYLKRVTYHVDGVRLIPLNLRGVLHPDRHTPRDEPAGEQEVWLELPESRIMRLDDGDHEVGATLEIARTEVEGPRDTKVRVEQLRLSRSFQLVTEPAPLVRQKYDRLIEAQIEGAITVRASESERGRVHVTVDALSPPEELAFQGYLQFGHSQYDLGWIILRAGQRKSLTLPVAPDAELTSWPEKVDVTLYPNPRAAEGTLDVVQIWGGMVTRYGVPLERRAEPSRAKPDRRK